MEPAEHVDFNARGINSTCFPPRVSPPLTPMPRLTLIAIAAAAANVSVCAAIEPEPANFFETSVRPMLMDTCGSCHSPDDDENKVRFLDATTAADLSNARSLWANAAEQLRNRTMPPADADQPSEEDRLRIASWIEERLRATACDGGEIAIPVTTRRLNRTEYDNTIRDLTGLDLSLSENFPADGSGGEGFDNNGETLFLPPLLMERYLEAADKILNAAVVSPRSEGTSNPAQLLPAVDLPKDVPHRSLSPGNSLRHAFIVYSAGSYTVRVKFRNSKAFTSKARLAFKVDGVVAFRREADQLKTENDVRIATGEIHLTRGLHIFEVRNTASRDSENAPAFDVISLGHSEKEHQPSNQQLAAHKQILLVDAGTRPENLDDHTAKLLRAFQRKAYRRQLSDDEVALAMTLYRRAAERGDPWEESVKLALKSVLVSPKFLFRIEQPALTGTTEMLTPFELATRLSYFLWGTMPDEKLLELADSGELTKDDVLAAQIDRMLDSPRSKVMSEQFVGQWLGTRGVAGRVAPDTGKFKGQFNTDLLVDMRQEPIETFDYIVRNDKPLSDLIDPAYAVVNERLAKHYGLMGKEGEKTEYGWSWDGEPDKNSGGAYKRIELKDKQRGGVLGMAGVHLLTSYPTRTSPVLRGGWVLETLLGVRIPAPPPNVPELKPSKKQKRSQREVLAAHREDSACAACHNLMDPVGFALDNFDVLGRWREESDGYPVDASATLPSGEEFAGPAGLKQVLLEKHDQFYRHITGKMLGFALGRSLADADDCTISRIVEIVENSNGSTRSLIKAVAMSHLFRMKSAPADQSVTTAPPQQISPTLAQATSR